MKHNEMILYYGLQQSEKEIRQKNKVKSSPYMSVIKCNVYGGRHFWNLF